VDDIVLAEPLLVKVCLREGDLCEALSKLVTEVIAIGFHLVDVFIIFPVVELRVIIGLSSNEIR
jgi:hypothetical protein